MGVCMASLRTPQAATASDLTRQARNINSQRLLSSTDQVSESENDN